MLLYVTEKKGGPMINNQKKQLIDLIIQRKQVFDTLKIKTMNDHDFMVAERIANLIPNVSPTFSLTGSQISCKEALDRSYYYLNTFGLIYSKQASDKAEKTDILKIFDWPFLFTTFVEYSFDKENKKVDKKSGVVNHFKTPKIFDEVSPMWLAHEHIHSLKETNYFEYIDGQIFGDVIPMFFELLIADNSSKKQEKSFLKNRLFLLKNEYDSTRQMKNELPIDLYNTYATSSMQYLNSYYYSLRLYELYQKNREDILTKIRDVLNGTKTTHVILQELNLLYNYDNKEENYI